MSKRLKVPDLYKTYDFYDVGNKVDYKVVSKKMEPCVVGLECFELEEIE